MAAVAVLSLGGLANAGINFSPNDGVYIGEATPFRCIRFRDGNAKIRFFPPTDWIFTTDGNKCAFRPPRLVQAGGTFAAKPKDGSKPLSDRMEELLRKGMPEGAEKITLVMTGLPQVSLDQWKSIHVEATYEHFGQTFRIALVAAQTHDEEIHARFGCRATDFDKVFPDLLESLGTFTWEEIESPSAKSVNASSGNPGAR